MRVLAFVWKILRRLVWETATDNTTGLAAYLTARQVTRLFVTGLATDFCVAWTALDARKAGFETYVVEDACRGIDTQGSLAKAWTYMAKAGVKRIQSTDIAA